MVNGYDSWKLSNPWDDGHFNEPQEEKSPIDEPHFYKFQVGKTKYSNGNTVYGMLLTTGEQIEIWKFKTIPNIQTDFHELDDIIGVMERLDKSCDFECIDEEEFTREYKDAIKLLNNIVQNEATI